MANHWLESDHTVHCERSPGEITMLCGSWIEGVDPKMKTTHAAINCRDCIATIEFCKAIRSGEWESTKRRQR